MENKIENLIGLATRAGKVTIGTNKILADLARQKVHLLLIAEDTSKNTTEKLMNTAKKHHTPTFIWNDSDTLAAITGNSLTVAIAITDSGFAKTIKNKMTKE